jgi:hypothetical protein
LCKSRNHGDNAYRDRVRLFGHLLLVSRTPPRHIRLHATRCQNGASPRHFSHSHVHFLLGHKWLLLLDIGAHERATDRDAHKTWQTRRRCLRRQLLFDCFGEWVVDFGNGVHAHTAVSNRRGRSVGEASRGVYGLRGALVTFGEVEY